MTLIRELIDIPEHVQRGDFVLRLTEGVGQADRTLGQYVVTPELRRCFDDALAFIRSALESNTSKATYLHGSFGSGKSHFMAVLHLILQGNTAARSINELAPVITKHSDWVSGKQFLLVPYHMIGAHDMESGILGGYVDFIRERHPEAPIPGVYLAEGLFKDAEALRDQIGDEAFFAGLNGGDGAGDAGWGELEASWDASRFEAAMAAAPGEEERSQLISALVGTYFKSYHTQANKGDAYVSLDKGLSVISRHAKSLGYDGLILFLDELVLWLASHAADLKFVHQEGQKLAKLVEAQTSDRPVPIVSFVARQRDLSELIGDSVPGAERVNFSDALKHWEGRFHTIPLEDRNLPAIAQKRVLRCKSEVARQELDAAFDQTAKVRESVMNVLLTSEGDREMFRKVYPFSPALVQTLIAVSSVLQRERTALKVMMQLLVDHREVLKVGDLVPVGDLFDVIAHGDEAFSQEMAIHFDNAKRLYHQKLLPLLEAQHGRREELEQLPYADAKRTAFRNDDRLVKTLLLSALVPQVESLRGLNAERLAALNHGTIKTPIPGREGQEVLRRVKTWAGTAGEIRIGEEANPTISVQLSGVDTEGIIEQARGIDNQGNRTRLIREMLFEQTGIEDTNEFFLSHEFLWRNTRRSCEVLFKNLRELPLSSLENSGDDWKLIIDYPFDEANHTPRDHFARIKQFNEAHPEGAKTICWVPGFFSHEAKKDLGTLVILDHILSGERFTQYANHLSLQDRQAAQSLLENQRSVLRQRVQNHLGAAYGLDAPGSLDTTHELELNERFQSLWPGFDLQPPAAANLQGAMHHLLGQALAHEFPAAPPFEAEVKLGALKKVYEVLSDAAQSPDGRVAVDRTLRPLLRQIANPLRLGEMGVDATHFVLGHHWKTHFTRKAAEVGTGMSVSMLRQWLDDPKPMGLPKEAANLVILVFAEQTNHSFYLHGAPYEATLSNLPDACELREHKLPPEEDWKAAVERAGHILGITVSPLLNVANVSQLQAGARQKAKDVAADCRAYVSGLQARLESFGVSADDADRLATAMATVALVEKLAEASDEKVVELLAHARIATSESAMGGCVGHGAALRAQLEGTNWEIFDAIARLGDERKPEADQVRRAVTEALKSDEHAVALGPALRGAQSKAVRLLSDVASTPAPAPSQPEPRPPQPQPEPEPEPAPGSQVISRGSQTFTSIDEAMRQVEALRANVNGTARTSVTVSWLIEKEQGR